MSAPRLSSFLPEFFSKPLTALSGFAAITALALGVLVSLPQPAAAQTSAVNSGHAPNSARERRIQNARAKMTSLPQNTPVEAPGATVKGGASLNFGAVGADKNGMEKQVSFTFTRMATIGRVDVLTMGAREADFKNAGSGTCEAGHTYATGSTCTVNVKFTPRHAGAVRGAVELRDENDDLIVANLIEGSGNRAQVIFLPGAEVTLPNTYNGTSADDFGIAVDGSGNVFTTNGNGDAHLYKLALQNDGTYTSSALYDFGPTAVNFGGIAVDGSGNVYVPDAIGSGGLYKFSGSNYTESYIFSGRFSSPNAVAFDPSGNMYVADFGDGGIGDGTGGLYKSTFNGSTFATPSRIMSGECVAVATDTAGNIYASFALVNEAEANVVYRWTPLLAGPVTVASSFVDAQGLAVDPAGNVYVADDNQEGQGGGTAGIFKETYNESNGSYSKSTLSLASNLTLPEAIAIDGDGNLYTPSRASGSSEELTYKLDYADPTTVTFPSTEEGNVSSPQSFTLENIGNVQLTISNPDSGSNPSASAGFQVVSGGTCPIITPADSPGAIGVNASCTYDVTFDPTVSTGPETGSVVIKDNEESGNTQTVPTSGAVTATQFALTSYSTTQLAGTSFTITVTAQNSSNATDTGYTGTVHFSSSDGSAVLPADSTLSNGTGTFTFTLNSTGGQTITATDTVATSLAATTSSITVNSNAATHFTVSAPGSATAGVSLNFTVTAENAQNSTATGYTGTVHFTSTDGQAILPADATLSNGVGSFNATLETAGSQTIKATDTVNPGISGNSNGIIVSPGAATSIALVSSAGSNVPWNANSQYVITAHDQFGNVATSDNDAMNMSSSSSVFVATPNPVSLVNGTVTVNAALGIAGSQSVTATDATNPSLTGTVFVNVPPGPASTFVFSAPSSTYAGSPIKFGVTAYDIFGNTATGYTGTVTFSSTDPAAILPSPSTLSNGAGGFTATLVSPGSQTITATDSANSVTGTSSGIQVTVPNFVVNVNGDDAGTAANCTPQTAPGTNATDTTPGCSLRDALLQSAAYGSANVSFDGTAFSASNSADQRSIVLSNGTLLLPQYTTVMGAVTGSGSTQANLVIVDGGGAGNLSSVFTTQDNALGTQLQNLTITNGNGTTGGAIYNGYQSTLTIQGSTISNSNSADGTGGIFNNYNATLTVLNSTISGNTGLVGGISTETGGSVTVTNSTLSGNAALSSGGAINNSGTTVTISDSTISGNTASFAGGGINTASGTTALSNTIVAGNSAVSTNADIEGAYTDNGGNVASADPSATSQVNPNLEPLSTYGGPTQTMVPLPGSAAICTGSTLTVPGGIATDQRGFGFDPNCPANSMDAGAVQTWYALQFNAPIPTGIIVAVPVSPAPSVSLRENGMLASSATPSVTVFDADSALTTPGSASLSSGTATFTNLVFKTVESSDTFTASLPISTSISINAPSTAFAVGAPSGAMLTSPTPGSTLTGSTETFTWTPGGATDAYYLLLGTKGVGSYDLDIAPASTKTSATFTNIPTNGGTLFARLYWRVDGTYYHTDYTYAEFNPVIAPALTSPAPGLGTVLSGSTQTFTWTPGQDLTGYYLILGTNGVGSYDLGASNASTATSATFTNIPTTGTTLFVRLAWRPATTGVYQYTDYQMTEAGTAQAPVLTSPTPGSTLPAANASFTWNPGVGSEAFELWVGTRGVGSSDAYSSGVLPATATSTVAPTLPAYGGTLYIRFSWRISGVWQHADSTCVESGTPVAPVFTSPTAGSTLGGSTQTFTWSPGMGPDTYYLLLGSKGVGSYDLDVSQASSSTSATFTNIPTTGGTVWARLYYRTAGVWQHADYTFIEQ